jgi:hypothetical protein
MGILWIRESGIPVLGKSSESLAELGFLKKLCGLFAQPQKAGFGNDAPSQNRAASGFDSETWESTPPSIRAHFVRLSAQP